MDVQTFDLPVNDVHAIDQMALTLISAQRQGVELAPELKDWLDFANNVVLSASGNQEI